MYSCCRSDAYLATLGALNALSAAGDAQAAFERAMSALEEATGKRRGAAVRCVLFFVCI